MTAYAQLSVTSPGPQSWPWWHCVGRAHQSGSAAAIHPSSNMISSAPRELKDSPFLAKRKAS
jgi:hypothetical protein